jgi:hypothetical protein
MFEQAGAALSILATVMVVAGKFTKDVAPHVLSVGIFLACFKALMNMGHSIKEVFELTETLLASNKIDKIETEKAQEKGEGINLQGKQARMIQQQNIKQNIGYESANVASWAMDAVGTAILGISSLSSLGVSTALSGGLATPIVAPICIVLSAIISITAENKAHKHSGNVEDIKELLELNPEMTKEDVEQKLISLKNQKHVTKEILEHIKENVPVSSSVKYHAGHYALNATSLLTLQLLHTPIKNLQIKNKHNYAQSFKLDEQQLIDTLVKTEFAKGTVLEPVTRNTSSDKAELIQFLELLSKSSNAGYIMTMLARDITHKERRLNPFNKKEKQIDIKDKFADTHLNHEGMKELRREQSLKDQYNIANGVIKDLAEKVGLDGESPDHAKILRALHEKTALFYRFSSKTELRHGTDILSGILSGMQEAELEEYKEEKKKEKAELKASKKLDNKDKPKETETKQATSTPDVKEIKEMKETKEFVGIPKPEINASVSDFSDMKKQFGLGELGETVKA